MSTTTLGDLLRDARAAADKSQAEIAEELKFTQPQIVKWEHNASVPALEDINRVAEAYEISPARLIPFVIRQAEINAARRASAPKPAKPSKAKRKQRAA
jgi:transcriptional regulator with XRE-family HTH domain